MGYYMRALVLKKEVLPLKQYQQCLKEGKFSLRIKVVQGSAIRWSTLLLEHKDGTPVAVIERNVVEPDEIGEEEIEEFLEDIEDCKPKSAVGWLKQYMKKVKVIYAFQVHIEGAEKGDGWQAIRVIKWKTKQELGGILQSDYEGFTNEDGSHILWQFGDHVSGPWQSAVLDSKGAWKTFKLELSNKAHRKAFCAGKVPAGLALI